MCFAVLLSYRLCGYVFAQLVTDHGNFSFIWLCCCLYGRSRLFGENGKHHMFGIRYASQRQQSSLPQLRKGTESAANHSQQQSSACRATQQLNSQQCWPQPAAAGTMPVIQIDVTNRHKSQFKRQSAAPIAFIRQTTDGATGQVNQKFLVLHHAAPSDVHGPPGGRVWNYGGRPGDGVTDSHSTV